MSIKQIAKQHGFKVAAKFDGVVMQRSEFNSSLRENIDDEDAKPVKELVDYLYQIYVKDHKFRTLFHQLPHIEFED